jgi:hypothetical protein
VPVDVAGPRAAGLITSAVLNVVYHCKEGLAVKGSNLPPDEAHLVTVRARPPWHAWRDLSIQAQG